MDSVTINIEPALSVLGILNLLGATQGLLLAVALLSSKSEDKTANRLLAALTLTISVIVSGAVLLNSQYVFVYPHLSRLHHPVVFWPSVALLTYGRYLEGKRFDGRISCTHSVRNLLAVSSALLLAKQRSKLRVYLRSTFKSRWALVLHPLINLYYSVPDIPDLILKPSSYSRRVKRGELARDEAVWSEISVFVIASSVFGSGGFFVT